MTASSACPLYTTKVWIIGLCLFYKTIRSHLFWLEFVRLLWDLSLSTCSIVTGSPCLRGWWRPEILSWWWCFHIAVKKMPQSRKKCKSPLAKDENLILSYKLLCKDKRYCCVHVVWSSWVHQVFSKKYLQMDPYTNLPEWYQVSRTLQMWENRHLIDKPIRNSLKLLKDLVVSKS